MTDATLTGSLLDALGDAYDYRRTKMWVIFNTENGRVTDADGKTRIGAGTATVNADGTFSVAGVPIPSASTNPTSFQVKVCYDAPPKVGQQRGRDRERGDFGWMTVTASADLSTLEAQQAVPAEYVTKVTAQLDTKVTAAQGYANDAAASAQTAHDVSNISTSDGVVTALVNDDASTTKDALSATFERTLAPTGGDDTSLIANALASGSVVLRGAFKIASTLAVPSSRTIRGVGASLTWTGADADASVMVEISNATRVNFHGIEFLAPSNRVRAIRGADCSHIAVRWCRGNAALLHTLSSAASYGSVTTATRSHHITVSGNVMTGSDKTLGTACVLLEYTDDWTVTDNNIDTYQQGIQWWGGDANLNADGAVANERKTTRGVTHGNIVRNINGGGIWGSMGQYLALGPDVVENCGDVGVDLEGCYDAVVNVGSIKDCTNGGIATFFAARNVIFRGGSVSSSSSAYTLARLISNPSQNRVNVPGLAYEGVSFECLSGIGVVDVSGPADFLTYRNNRHRNVRVNLAIAGYGGTVVADANALTFDTALTAADSLFKVTPVAGGGRQTVTHNHIRSTVTQPAGTVGIDVQNSDFNSSPVGEVAGNVVVNVPSPIVLRWSGGNAGTVARYRVRDNSADAITKDTTGAANTAVVIQQANNYTANLSSAVTVA